VISIHIRFLSVFLRVFFKLLYHEFAWTYDWVAAAVSMGKWQDWVLAALPYLPGPRVLELGHGPGHLQVALHKRGVSPIGLDESRHMGRQAYRRIVRGGFIPLCVNGYAQFMPFQSHSIHQVVATFPSEYLTDPQTLAEVSRILIPGGELVVIPLAWITGRRPHERLAAWLFRFTNQAPEWDDRFLEPFHRAGFISRLERLSIKSSTVLVIRSIKA
jgi:ubiquinone/menaquinone biosynthesis C-methylase UbiE